MACADFTTFCASVTRQWANAIKSVRYGIYSRPMRGLFGKALVLAATVALASMVFAAAGTATSTPCGATFTCVPVSWEPTMTSPLTGPYLAPPTTTTTLVGVPFAMQNAFIMLGPGTSTVAGGLSVANPTAVYLLINAANTPLATAGSPAGSVTLTFADGTTSTTALVLGTNVREWKIGAPATVNTVTSTANIPWWTGPATDGMAATIDMLTISLPAGAPSLVSVTVTNSAPRISLLVTGLTVVDPPAPIVTPPPAPPASNPSQKVEDCKAALGANGGHSIGSCVSGAAHAANAARQEARPAARAAEEPGDKATKKTEKHGDRKASKDADDASETD
jgi:hypothetical protein